MALRKYGVATSIMVPVIKAGSIDFAVTGDWTPAAGDVKVSKDEGAFANVGTLPTAQGSHWDFTLSATEMQASRVVIQVVDSATKAVEDQSIIIETYGHASAEHALDLDTATVTVGTNNDKTGYRLSATGVDDILDEVYEGTTTFRQFLRVAASALFGKLSGAATTTVNIRDEADTKNRIAATVDASGNRSAVTLDKT